MAKIVSILTSQSDILNKYVDAWLIPVKNLSCRSFFEYELNQIKQIKEKTNKELYLLCDKLISESEVDTLVNNLDELFETGDLIFFQDLSIFNFAKKNNLVDKLVYYSPTLVVSYQDIGVLYQLGLNKFILSKESTYNDYISILSNYPNLILGMLSFGYPQIYYSKRKMISSFKEQYKLVFDTTSLKIKEKTRNFYQPIVEDNNGTYIFAGEIFFPYKYLNEFAALGMELFLIDPSFVNSNNIEELVYRAITDTLKEDIDFASTYLMFEEMVNDYGK